MCYVSDHFVKNEIEPLNFDVRCIKLYKLYELVYTFLIRLLVGRAFIGVQKLQGLFESKTVYVLCSQYLISIKTK